MIAVAMSYPEITFHSSPPHLARQVFLLFPLQCPLGHGESVKHVDVANGMIVELINGKKTQTKSLSVFKENVCVLRKASCYSCC